MLRTANRTLPSLGLAVTMLVAACGGGGAATPTAPIDPTAAPTTAPASSLPTAAPTTPVPAATSTSTGPANLDAVAEVQAGAQFDVNWTGPNANKDYVTIVPDGATKWTNEPFFYTTAGTPGKLAAPSQDGAYALWYVSGADGTILAPRPIRVLPFTGDLLAPETVMGNTEFEVAWNGPNGPGDYVTIVKAGAAKWTNEDYFYTTEGSPSELVAPLEAGAYEVWYVIGSDSTVKARRPIAVTPATATVTLTSNEVNAGQPFEVGWTGPAGPGDFLTIVPVGSPNTAYLNYFYTTSPSPGTLTAPPDGGAHEVRYVTGIGNVVLATKPILVK